MCYITDVMRTELNTRLREIGLRKKDLAALLGINPKWMSQIGRTAPVPGYVAFAVEAWALMSNGQKRQLEECMSKD